MKSRGLLVGVAIGLLAAARAEAVPIGPLTPTATELVAAGGQVVIYFAGQSAAFDSVLNLIDPAGFPAARGTDVRALVSQKSAAGSAAVRRSARDR